MTIRWHKMSERQFAALVATLALAFVVPLVGAFVSAMAYGWLQMMNVHDPGNVWAWLDTIDGHDQNGPVHNVSPVLVTYEWALLNVYIVYQFCEAAAWGVRWLGWQMRPRSRRA